MITKKQRKIIIKQIIDFVKYRILHVDDSCHRIALGLALGIFVAYMPPLALHIVLVIFLSFILRANKFVALTSIWLSNPLTYIPLYYPNYLLGRAVLAFFHTEQRLDPDQVTAAFEDLLSFGRVITGFYTSQFWKDLGSFFVQVGFEMFIGGLVIGGFVAVVAYFLSYKLIDWYRKKHPHHFPHHI